MNRAFFFCVVLSCAAASRSGAAPDAAVPAPAVVPADAGDERFAQMGTDYKKPQVLPDTFFNPFKSDTSDESAMQKRESASVTNEVVTSALTGRSVSGIVYAKDVKLNQVIIGDQVFGVGDELTFPSKDRDKDAPVPLVAGAAVVLTEVARKSLTFDISPEGEPTRHLVFPLRSFWRP